MNFRGQARRLGTRLGNAAYSTTGPQPLRTLQMEGVGKRDDFW